MYIIYIYSVWTHIPTKHVHRQGHHLWSSAAVLPKIANQIQHPLICTKQCKSDGFQPGSCGWFWMVLDCALPSEIQSRTLLSITGAVVISAGKSGREERSSISAKFHKGQSVDCVKITTYTRCIVMYRYRTWLLLCLSYPRIHWLTSARTIIVFFQSCCSLRHVYWRNQ